MAARSLLVAAINMREDPGGGRHQGGSRVRCCGGGEAVTEATVYAAIQRMFKAPAFILLAGVRNQTGYTRRVRTADALAVSVFPSRGLYAVGFEIKTDRGDWRRELADPEKSEEIMR